MAKRPLTSASTRGIEKIKEAYPGAREFRVREEVEVGGVETGELCYIEFEDPKDGEQEVYVFVKKDASRIFDDVPSHFASCRATILEKSVGSLQSRMS